MSKLLGGALALLMLAAAIPAGVAAAPEPSAKTRSADWTETLAARRGTTTRALLDVPLHSAHDHRGADTTETATPSVTYTSPVDQAPHEFGAVGAHWKAVVPEGASVEVSVRTSVDGLTWSPWRLTDADHGDPDRDRDGRAFGALVIGDGLRFAQYRVTTFPSGEGAWPLVRDVTLTYIDASGGPTGDQAQRTAVARTSTLGDSTPPIISRAEWGADESLRFDADGEEKWGREYLPVTQAVIHSTVTQNHPSNPAAVVRSIYYYHAITRDWGDVGYSYMIDEQGRIYEGRAGGKNVVAGHGRCYNPGTIGIAALGWYGPAYGGTPAGIYPPAALVSSLKQLLSWQFDMHGIDPFGRGVYTRRSVQPLADIRNIGAHYDLSNSTWPCGNTHVDPGKYLYDRFPEIRQAVADALGYRPTPNPVVESVRFWPTNLYTTDTLRVDVTIRNDGTGVMDTQGPHPSTSYLESQTYLSSGFPKVTGKYRILVDQSNDPTGQVSPYRFGLGTPLVAGERRTVSGFVTLERGGTGTWWAGLNRENVNTPVARMGDTTVVVTPRPTLVSASPSPHLLSPNGDGRQDTALWQARFSETVAWQLDIKNPQGAVVRSVRGQGASAAVTWDGKDSLSMRVADGAYTYALAFKNATGAPGLPHGGTFVVDTVAPGVGAPAVNGHGPKWLAFTASESIAYGAVIVDAGGVVVATYPTRTASAGKQALSWDGLRADGTVAPEGAYRWRLFVRDLASNRTAPYPIEISFRTPPTTVTVDNGGTAFTASSAWATSAYPTPYGADYRSRLADGSAADPATWRATLAGGTYDVYVWYTPGTNRSLAGHYTISTSAGPEVVTVDQRTGGNAFALIARVTVTGGENTVTLTAPNGSSGYVIADAVQLVRVR